MKKSFLFPAALLVALLVFSGCIQLGGKSFSDLKGVYDKYSLDGVIAPGSIEELAKAMRMLYDDRDLGDRLGIRAREFIVNNRDWGQRIKTEVDIYAQLLKQQKRH